MASVPSAAELAAAEAARRKEEGNAALKAGELDLALAAYTDALRLANDPQVRAPLLANRALAHLKRKEHVTCAEDCTAALELDPRYVKALFRRAQAYEALGKLNEAFNDIRLLLSLEPSNKEARTFAAKIKEALQQRMQASDLSTPKHAVDALMSGATGDERLRAVGKLSRIADDSDRALEMQHAGAVSALLALLPPVSALHAASNLDMPLVGIAVEALDKLAASGASAVLCVVGNTEYEGSTKETALDRILRVAGVAAGASKEADAEARVVEVDEAIDETADVVSARREEEQKAAEQRLKNCVLTACRALSLVAHVASSATAARSQETQGRLLVALFGYVQHNEVRVASAAQDAVLRVVSADKKAAITVLPKLLIAMIQLLGDEESNQHKLAVAVITRVMAQEPKEPSKPDPEDMTKAFCAACETALSPILRSDDSEWEKYVAAIHGVTVILEANKDVGSWLLRQESIFWSLAEVAEMDDEDLLASLGAIYAHAANDPQHFRDKAGDEPIKHLKTMLKSAKPRVRCRACVALAKVALIHQNHRVNINPTGKLLSATLGLLEAKVPTSVHRWAVDALMFLTVMPDVKAHLVEKQVKFGSLVALAESAGKDSSFHFSIIQTFRRLCVPREKPEDQKKLEREMDKEQIEQMRQLAAGGVGAAPSEKEDDPQQLRQLAERLVSDDAPLVVAEVVARTKSPGVQRLAAQILQAMADVVDGRGKLVQQGAFKAMLTLTLVDDEVTKTAAAWALAKVGISINPALYPQRTGSGPEGMVGPILRMIDNAESELQQFEGSMALCNLATVPALRDRIVAVQGWRTLQMTLTSDNPMVQRAALECMCNLVTNESIAERFTHADSTDMKIFVSFCSSDDAKAQIAASGALATLADVPEIGAAIIKARGLEPLAEIALLSEDPALLHRAAVGLKGLLGSNIELVVGKVGDEHPDHAMLTLGALSMLSRDNRCEPAKRAAVEALLHLKRTRPDLVLPPPEAVALVVANLREEAARRAAEAEAEQAEEPEEIKGDPDIALATATKQNGTAVETIAEEDEEGTIL